eukprot:Gregarina_sp_Poly_1__2583@NODE_16_length_22882_cov_82_653956_g14_i0_p8_GENE_NODE_16_length_22882_cov_82_653956_g14_i0NODE_16_length_22882_cov_82_653956_g14_i0_p8_ORF_typecomplete_len277_score42_17PsbW/PF07123_12/1_1e02PsbW/PF07123_12/7PsbW/PF07123_12/1_2e04_NODE_16_length_22882_cov_82_653956_g14_i01299413824
MNLLGWFLVNVFLAWFSMCKGQYEHTGPSLANRANAMKLMAGPDVAKSDEKWGGLYMGFLLFMSSSKDEVAWADVDEKVEVGATGLALVWVTSLMANEVGKTIQKLEKNFDFDSVYSGLDPVFAEKGDRKVRLRKEAKNDLARIHVVVKTLRWLTELGSANGRMRIPHRYLLSAQMPLVLSKMFSSFPLSSAENQERMSQVLQVHAFHKAKYLDFSLRPRSFWDKLPDVNLDSDLDALEGSAEIHDREGLTFMSQFGKAVPPDLSLGKLLQQAELQ